MAIFSELRDEVQSFGEIRYLEFIQDRGRGSRVNFVKIEIQNSF